MIELCRIGLINWHLLPAMDIEVAGNIGVIGENRSGKSTVLDGIQVVITGNSRRYLRLNASANDGSRRRGLRSVHAYCLGRLSPDQIIRPEGALSYLFLTFKGPGLPGGSCSIGVALEASPAESVERVLGQFIVPGRMLSVADFIDRSEDGSGETPRDWALLKPWLENVGGTVFRDEAGKFVADYLKALSTGRQFLNPDRFQKAFVNAISFEQIDSATDFVRRFLLSQNDIQIGQLKESIATYQRLRRNIEDAKARLEQLEAMHALIETFKADLAAYDRERWIAARAGLDWHYSENRRLRRSLARALTELDEARREQTEYDRLKRQAESELDGVKAAIVAQSMGRRPEFDKDRKIAETTRKEALRQLAELQLAINQGFHAVRFRARFATSDATVFDLIERARTAGGMSQLPAWPENPQALAAVLDDPRLQPGPVQERFQAAIETAIKRQAPLEDRSTELRRRIDDIGRAGVSLERNVEELVADLRALGYRPRILCSMLEVTDDAWRHAAEALLGRDREAIIVDDTFVEDAIRYLQRNRQRFRGCRIVNTRKIDVRAALPEAGTLASVLTASDPMAMAFVIRRIGNVRLAHSIQDLHRPGRAIMRDGTYDDGLIVEMREVFGGHKIGAGAGKAGLAALERELAELSGTLAQSRAEVQALQAASRSLSLLAGVVGKGADLIRLGDELQHVTERLDQILADIRALEQNIDPALGERQAVLESTTRTYETEARDAHGREVQAKGQVADATRKLGSGEGEAGSDLALKLAYRRLCDVRHLRLSGRPGYRSALLAERGDFRRAGETARQAADAARNRFIQGKADVFDLYLAYHSQFGLKPDFTRAETEPVRDLAPWVDQNRQRIREVDLIRYEDHAAAAAERTRNFFQHSFAFELRKRFEDLRHTLQEMNRTLAGHDFHYERYHFRAEPVDLYRDIIKLVEESYGDPTVFAHLFDTEVADDHPHVRALRTMQALLLDETRDVKEFEDYRKYFVFNLIMKDLKSGREVDLETRRGTGSGAEQQVPFYVAIGTALAAAYHGKAAGDASKDKGIGLVVLDEAFTKLDGKNQKACMEYYRKLGLQVMVAAPSEKRATLYETMDWFVETIRNGDAVEIEPYGIHERTRQAFADANPANIGLDRFREMMTAGGKADAA